MMKKILLAVTATAMIIPAVFANDFEKAEDAIKYRQAAYGLIAFNFGEMGAMLKGEKTFDQAQFNIRADNLAALSKLPHEAFVEGSDKGDTDALPAIWQDKADFDKKMNVFTDSTATLAIAAKSNDKNAIKAAFLDTAKSCKACHKVYRD